MNDPTLKVLSLGVGVQSSTLFLMSCMGVLPKIDFAINSDTQWESKATYAYREYLEQIGKRYSIPIYVTTAGNIRSDALNARMRVDEYKELEGGRWASLPLFTRNADGTVGRIKRQCTKEYKLEPIRRQLSDILKERGIKKSPGVVEQWIGISRDEMKRMRLSDARYIVNRFPLVFDIPMTRLSCLQWLEDNDFQIPKKSACLGCPFKSNPEWRKVQEDPEEWSDVVEFDKAIRATGGAGGETFLHRSCVPLDEVDLSTAEERGQANWLEECTGMCGV